MPPVAQPRLPFQPIIAYLRPESNADAARRLGLANATFYKCWRDGVRLDTADTLAVRAGAHPVELWGDDWIDAVEEHRYQQANRRKLPRNWPAEDRHGWREVERSWDQWRQQRQRNLYAALDAASERDAA